MFRTYNDGIWTYLCGTATVSLHERRRRPTGELWHGTMPPPPPFYVTMVVFSFELKKRKNSSGDLLILT